MATNRRIRRKLHRQALTDVLFGASVSYVWRARLYEAGVGVELLVDASTLDDVPRASTTPCAADTSDTEPHGCHEWTRGWQAMTRTVMFRLRAEEFPDVVGFSANNPATIYGRPRQSPAR